MRDEHPPTAIEPDIEEARQHAPAASLWLAVLRLGIRDALAGCSSALDWLLDVEDDQVGSAEWIAREVGILSLEQIRQVVLFAGPKERRRLRYLLANERGAYQRRRRLRAIRGVQLFFF